VEADLAKCVDRLLVQLEVIKFPELIKGAEGSCQTSYLITAISMLAPSEANSANNTGMPKDAISKPKSTESGQKNKWCTNQK